MADEYADMARQEEIEILTDKAFEAIKAIKELCGMFEDCKDCPLYKDKLGCGVETNPYNWEFEEG